MVNRPSLLSVFVQLPGCTTYEGLDVAGTHVFHLKDAIIAKFKQMEGRKADELQLVKLEGNSRTPLGPMLKLTGSGRSLLDPTHTLSEAGVRLFDRVIVELAAAATGVFCCMSCFLYAGSLRDASEPVHSPPVSCVLSQQPRLQLPVKDHLTFSRSTRTPP